MDKITESCFIWEIGFATRVFRNLTRFVPKKAAIWIYWPFSLGAILAKYLDVCETTATTTHILRATSTVLINIVLNRGQSVGGLHRQGVYYAVCREQERELGAVTTTEQRETPPGKRGWQWCLECEFIFTVNTSPVEHKETSLCLCGKGPFTWEAQSGRICLFWQLLVWNASSLDSLWPRRREVQQPTELSKMHYCSVTWLNDLEMTSKPSSTHAVSSQEPDCDCWQTFGPYYVLDQKTSCDVRMDKSEINNTSVRRRHATLLQPCKHGFVSWLKITIAPWFMETEELSLFDFNMFLPF